MKASWLILDREGNPKDPSSFPPRPEDSNPEDGNPYTPWHRSQQHVHIENDQIDGVHAQGTLEEQQALLNLCLKNEGEILTKFGVEEDSIPVAEVLKFLAS